MSSLQDEFASRLRFEVQEAQRELRLARPDEKPQALRHLTDALYNFARVVLDGVIDEPPFS